MRSGLSRWRVVVLLAAVVFAISGCSGSKSPDSAKPTTVPVAVETTLAPVTTVRTEVTIGGAPRTDTTIPTNLGPGQARITGTVTGPEGPVNGAVVRVERFAGQSKASVEVNSANGAWSVDSILGGAYRVQAFRTPDLAQGQAQSFFLGATETKDVALTLLRYGDNTLTATVDPNPPLVGVSTLLTVTSADAAVDARGQLSRVGRSGVRMQLVVSSSLLIESQSAVVTDATGTASWRFRCLAPGTFSVSLVISGAGSTLSLPPCAVGPGG